MNSSSFMPTFVAAATDSLPKQLIAATVDHMDGAVLPDSAGGRLPAVGIVVAPEPGVLSRCPYGCRVRCESDGAVSGVDRHADNS